MFTFTSSTSTGNKQSYSQYRVSQYYWRLQEIEAEAHCNAFYRHFYYFVKEHKMMEEKDYAPLQALTNRIC